MGTILMILGATLAVVLGGIGSIIGVALSGQAAAGVIADDPSKAGKAIILSALPGTQGIYGFLGAFLVMLWFGILQGEIPELTNMEGWAILGACLPVALGGLLSGMYQGKVVVASMNVLAKKPGETGKAIVLAVLVETYAILGLLISIFLLKGLAG